MASGGLHKIKKLEISSCWYDPIYIYIYIYEKLKRVRCYSESSDNIYIYIYILWIVYMTYIYIYIYIYVICYELFLGAEMAYTNFVSINDRINNHQSWLKITADLSRNNVEISGIALTGWSRYVLMERWNQIVNSIEYIYYSLFNSWVGFFFSS